MQITRTHRRMHQMFALAMSVGFGTLTSNAAAEESLFNDSNLFRNAQIEQMFAGDVVMAGNQRAGMHLSSSSQTRDARYASLHDHHSTSDTGVHLSVKLSW